MTVKDLMFPNRAWVDADGTLADAVTKMQEENVAWLPVLSDGKVVGVVTDREIAARLTSPGCNLASIKVREALSTEAVCCHADDLILDVLILMDGKSVSRAIVLDREEKPFGYVSFAEVWPERYRGPCQTAGDEGSPNAAPVSDTRASVM